MVRHAAILPVSLLYAEAAIAAFPSCLTTIYRIPGFFRIASTIPREEVPGRPNTTFTPQATSSATITSEPVVAEPGEISSAESILNASFPAPQTGHVQVSGRFSKGEPAGIPAFGSPVVSS